MRFFPSGPATLITATIVLRATMPAFGQSDPPNHPSPLPLAEARATVVELLGRASPKQGSIRAHYDAVKAPGRKLIQGFDLGTGAWFKINGGDVQGFDASGVYYKGRAQPNAIWPTDPGRNAIVIKQSSYVEEAFPQIYPRFMAKHPELIERIDRNAAGGWILFMTFPCATWTLAFAPPNDVVSCERKTTQLHLATDGLFLGRGIPGMFDQPDLAPDSPSGWPVVKSLGGPDGWRLTGIDWSPTPRPEWFTMQNVEAFAIDHAGDPSDRPLAAQPDGSLAHVAPDGSRIPVPPVNTAGGTTNWSRWLLGGGGVLSTLGLVAWLWQRRTAA